MSRPTVTSVTTTWVSLVDGTRGWTGFPRFVVWMCVPAYIATAAAIAGRALEATALGSYPVARASVHAADAVAILFGSLGMFSTLLAAPLALLLSLLRRWRLRVVCWLWSIVFLGLALTFPAVASAFRSWMALQGTPLGQ